MIKYLLTILGLRKEQVYCQECGKDITSDGGDVTSSGIYCHGDKPGRMRCAVQALFKAQKQTDKELCMVANAYSPREVQGMIARGEIKKFGPLEQAAQG